MFDRFTDPARKVMGLARQETQRFSHWCIGTEHILLALLLEEQGLAAEVLRDLGVDPAKVQAEVEAIVRPRAVATTSAALPLSPRARRSLELAVAEHQRLGDRFIGTEHLLLGVLGQAEGAACRVLSSLGVAPARVRDLLIERLGGEPAAASPAASGPALPLTSRARRTIELATEEAAVSGHARVGTDHLFLAMLQQADGVPARVLAKLGLPLETIRDEVRALLGADAREYGPDES